MQKSDIQQKYQYKS